MTTTLTQPMIPGFAGEVEQFAAEHGMTETLFGLYEAANRIFHQASGVRLELYEDPEDSTWISVYYVIEGWAESVEVTLKSNDEWYQELHDHIPPNTDWSIGHTLEWTI